MRFSWARLAYRPPETLQKRFPSNLTYSCSQIEAAISGTSQAFFPRMHAITRLSYCMTDKSSSLIELHTCRCLTFCMLQVQRVWSICSGKRGLSGGREQDREISYFNAPAFVDALLHSWHFRIKPTPFRNEKDGDTPRIRDFPPRGVQILMSQRKSRLHVWKS